MQGQQMHLGIPMYLCHINSALRLSRMAQRGQISLVTLGTQGAGFHTRLMSLVPICAVQGGQWILMLAGWS